MTDWTDEATADPIGDLQLWQKQVAADCGVRPTNILMTSGQLEMYEWITRRDEIIRDLLKRTTRRNVVRRYVLRRVMGQRRLAIIAPRLEQIRFRAKMYWNEWKHRNDPYWEY